jgi:recombination protein RecT
MSTETRITPVQEIRVQLDRMDFHSALPSHIPVERFKRVLMTAIQNNPELVNVDRKSLFNSAMKAAQDGLLPDGREGAMVVRFGRNGKEASWQPMVAGIRKKVRNSGEIVTWDVFAVHANDHFEYELGDNPFIKHKPTLSEPGALIAVYSVATLKGGEKSRDVMSVHDVNRIRDTTDAYKAFKAGKIKSTPWNEHYDEMAKKTLARRHSKVLPMSTDLDDLIRRDDELYDHEGASDSEVKREEARPRPTALQGRLDALASPAATTDAALPAHDPLTGEIQDDAGAEDNAGTQEDGGQVEETRAAKDEAEDAQVIEETKAAAGSAQASTTTAAMTADQYEDRVLTLIESAKDAEQLAKWWNSPKEKALRSSTGMEVDRANALKSKVEARVNELKATQG